MQMKSVLTVANALIFTLLAGCASPSVKQTEAKPAPATIPHVPAFEDLAREADGSASYMNQDGAIKYCASKGSHLPTVREYTELATSQGAKGIRETAYKDMVYSDPLVVAERERNGKDGYFVIYRQTADGKTVIDYYYNKVGYKKPAGEFGTTWFWTASQFPVDSGLAFVFDGPAGVIHYGFYHAKWYPVRCVSGLQ